MENERDNSSSRTGRVRSRRTRFHRLPSRGALVQRTMTLWRDAKGKFTVPGSLFAVTPQVPK